ncbi:MAG: hypothetical protein ACF8CQ_13000 [Rhodopirellula sp. JB044]|uniref:hypothetical protein n=1 Tax=Rhodopirellula sp. JB044 TaxID=3342844 RepID=UPI00370B1C7E
MRTKWLWIVHALTLMGVTLWAALDLRFEPLLRSLSRFVSDPQVTFQSVLNDSGTVRVVMLLMTFVLAASTLVALFVRLFRSAHFSRARSITSLLAITTIVAVWCGVFINRSSLAWQGKRARMAIRVDRLEALAEPLRRQWPARDGELPGVGPFMAYPFGRPTTLILLQSPLLAGDELCIAAVEGNEQGPIRFQLSGSSHDDWAEWHPDASQPESFVGGLGDSHQIVTATKVGRQWYLVRYAAPEQRRSTESPAEIAAI